MADQDDGLSAADGAIDERRLKIEELRVRRLEAKKDLRDLDAPWWRRPDPLLLAVLAAAIGLVGNMMTTILANNNTVQQEKARADNEQALEDRKAQYNLILQSIATNDPAAATRNIRFFIESGLLQDKNGRIAAALAHYSPVLPGPSGDVGAGASSLSPAGVAHTYNLPEHLDGTGQTIGLIEFGGGYASEDLKRYFAKAKLALPHVVAVGVDGGHNAPGAGGGVSMDSQVEADVEVAGGAAPKAALRVYFAPFSSRSLADAIDRAVGDRVSVISIGWGQPESAWTQTDVAVVNAALQRAALRGVTVVVASGNGGVTDGVKDGKRHVDFPASSPWVLAVGGTSFDRHSGAGEGEHAWSGSGGGESAIFPRPTWQSALTFRAPGSRVIGRALPDLASSADPAAGYPLMVDGSFVQMGGTTIAAPEVAALIACINQGLGRNVGWITPALYQGMGATALDDITVGDNTADGVTGFKAGPGWDAVTGWGSLDAARALAWLRSHGKSP